MLKNVYERYYLLKDTLYFSFIIKNLKVLLQNVFLKSLYLKKNQKNVSGLGII